MSEMQHLQWDFVEVRPMSTDDLETCFPVRSVYAEALWLPIIGPSATWALRRLAALVEQAGSSETVWLDLGRFGIELGIGGGVGRHSTVRRTLRRLVQFGLAMWDGDVLFVRCTVPPLSSGQLLRLPSSLCRMHAAMTSNHPDRANKAVTAS